jgi:hypothetical protein
MPANTRAKLQQEYFCVLLRHHIQAVGMQARHTKIPAGGDQQGAFFRRRQGGDLLRRAGIVEEQQNAFAVQSGTIGGAHVAFSQSAHVHARLQGEQHMAGDLDGGQGVVVPCRSRKSWASG